MHHVDVQAADTPANGKNSRSYKMYFLVLLTFGYALNYADRQLIAVLLEPIKRDLVLSDTQLGVLGGAAFALFYVTLGVPIASLADRHSRVKILSGAIALWSAATAACGAVGNFVQLVLMRIMVATGEAAGTPPSVSLISDLFGPKRRATANSIFLAGGPVGLALGLAGGGWLSQEIGWRWTFVAVGVPGVLFSLLVILTLREPPRRGNERGEIADAPPLVAAATSMLRRRSFVAMATATGIAFFAGMGMTLWLPSFLIRSYGISTAEAGVWLAGIHLSTGIGAPIVVGLIADRLSMRDKRWLLWLPAIILVLATPPVFFIFTSNTVAGALIWIFVTKMFYHGWGGLVHTANQALVGARMRAVATAMLLMIVNVIGMGFGPAVIGWISDMLRASYGAESLRLSLLITTVPVFIASALVFLYAAHRFSRDIANDAN